MPDSPRLARWRPLMLLLLTLAVTTARAGSAPVAVAVDERVELLSIIARLAGNDIYNAPAAKSPYAERVDRRFEPFRDHAAVAAYRTIRDEYGTSYDALPALAVHLDGVSTLLERIPFEQDPPRLDERWPTEPTRRFLAALRDFAVASDARGFFAGEQEFYAACASRYEPGLVKAGAVEWFDTFLGVKPGAVYRVIPGLLCGNSNYGVGVRFPDGRPEEVLPVLGCSTWDAGGLPVFTPGAIGTYVHELCHSYTNQVVDRHLDELAKGGNALFPLVAERMSAMAYPTWRIMTCETFVRACVIRYLADTQGPQAAALEAERQVANGFTWVPEVATALASFAAARDRFPTLDAFVPEIAGVLEKSAATLAAETEARAKIEPHVVSLVPPNGAVDVDPALAELVVTFDRPMRPSGYSFVGDAQEVPEAVAVPRWNDSLTTLTVAVRLVPGRAYHFRLNYGQFQGFRAADGTPLAPVEVRFTVADR